MATFGIFPVVAVFSIDFVPHLYRAWYKLSLSYKSCAGFYNY